MRGKYCSNVEIKVNSKNKKVYSSNTFDNQIIRLALFLGYDVTYVVGSEAKNLFGKGKSNHNGIELASDDRYFKAIPHNPFNNGIARIKNWVKGINIKTIIGRLNVFRTNEYSNSKDGVKVPKIYCLQVNCIDEYERVIKFLNDGYTVVVNLEVLNEDNREFFRKKLQIGLFGKQICCYRVNSNLLFVAPSKVDVQYCNDPKKEKVKLLYLRNYKKK